MAWRNTHRNANDTSLASELRRLLFSGGVGGSGSNQQQEWMCHQCNTPNYMSRGLCRRCACQRKVQTSPKQRVPLKTKTTPPPPKTPALAPWATAEMVEERAGKLEEAIEAAKASGGCDKAVRSLENELKHQNKKGAEPQSVLGLIEGTKNYISRAEKRHIGITEQIVALQEQQAEIDKELRKARTRLADMEVEAAKQLNMQPKVAENTSSGLEDAVRMLMVAMHTCQNLPPKLAEAVAVVSSCLPPSAGVSEDAHEEKQGMTVDGGAGLKEEDVPAGQLDAALPPDRFVGTVAVWSPQLSGKRDELDHCTTDEEFLAWAKAAKRFRAA